MEHALGAAPRLEHGYCVDDAARAVVLLCREPSPSAAVAALAGRYTVFLVRAQGPGGAFHNRLGYDGQWHDEPGTGDWWGRALWGIGTAAARGPDWIRAAALSCFDSGAGLRPPHVRAMAFAAFGAAQVLAAYPAHRAARELLADAAAAIGTDGPDSAWPWPQERLHYANAALPQVLISAGDLLGDPAMKERGLRLLDWLLETESVAGHLSPTPVGGRSPGDERPGFDQQPIEIATLADACACALAVTGDPRWARGIELAAAWFEGENDVRAPMRDPATGGGYDGLTPTGPNGNQGAESTLALLSTLQHHRRLQMEKL
ncbi:MAG TPA: glycosyltransferase [Actinocrinis sp.]|uniref:glycosyltransferase n=1 Tax=Actinocrinis sp. TaxID=1920516 RepID=UPI002DDCC2D4|nr:glycosyltransferase [Actinocrinis sp.]HEV3173842.1 glycosyltransferase [Actinocrinis sp.]